MPGGAGSSRECREPGSLSKWISPRLVVTMLRTVVNPKPVPWPALLVVKNGSKRRWRVSASMPLTVVADSEKDAGKARQAAAAYRSGAGDVLKLTVAGLDGNATAVGQGVASVENEVEEDLLRLRLIDRDQTQIRIEAVVRARCFRRSGGSADRAWPEQSG